MEKIKLKTQSSKRISDTVTPVGLYLRSEIDMQIHCY